MTRTMYDSVSPVAIPRDAGLIAGYVDGPRSRWPDAAWGWFPNATIVRIAVNPSINDGQVIDVEPGDWPAAASVDWVLMRRASGLLTPTVYCGTWAPGYTWQNVLDAFAARGVPPPLIWLAYYDWGQIIPDGCIAKQYASDSMLGTGYDLSVVADYWPGIDPPPQPTPDPSVDYLADAANARARIQRAQTELVAAVENITY